MYKKQARANNLGHKTCDRCMQFVKKVLVYENGMQTYNGKYPMHVIQTQDTCKTCKSSKKSFVKMLCINYKQMQRAEVRKADTRSPKIMKFDKNINKRAIFFFFKNHVGRLTYTHMHS